MASAGGCLSNCTKPGFFQHEWTADEFWTPWEVLAEYFEYQPWLFSLLGSAVIGLSGVFPLLVINIDEAADRKQGESSKTLKILLSFAVGGLLGDVFLHLLPEAWQNYAAAYGEKSIAGKNHGSLCCGLWVLSGFLVFVIAEKLFSGGSSDEEEEGKAAEPRYDNNNCNGFDGCYKVAAKNGYANGELPKLIGLKKLEQPNGVKKQLNGFKHCNGYANGYAKINEVKNGFCAIGDAPNGHADQQLYEKKSDEQEAKEKTKHISGYLNLMANCVDNFTHGLAVGGSFLVSFRLGALTTFAILIHEIPHEIGDFAILLRSGFNRWDAAKAQLMTATGGLCGAFVAVVFSGDAVEAKTSWILPFTAGGFLHIGMVTVLPELLKETDSWESLKQIGALLTGIVVMATLTIMFD